MFPTSPSEKKAPAVDDKVYFFIDLLLPNSLEKIKRGLESEEIRSQIIERYESDEFPEFLKTINNENLENYHYLLYHPALPQLLSSEIPYLEAMEHFCNAGKLNVIQFFLNIPVVKKCLADPAYGLEFILLQSAVTSKNQELVKLLLELPAISSKENLGETAFQDALEYGLLDIAKLIYNQYSFPLSDNIYTWLVNTVESGNVALLIWLLEINAIKKCLLQSPELLGKAAAMGHHDMVNYLLGFPYFKENATYHDNFAFNEAAKNNNLAVCELLIKLESVVQAIKDDYSTYDYIVENGLDSIFRLILENCDEICNDNLIEETITKAASLGHLSIITILNEYNRIAVTAYQEGFNHAASNGHYNIVRYMLKRCYPYLDQPLLNAFENRKLSIIELILQHYKSPAIEILHSGLKDTKIVDIYIKNVNIRKLLHLNDNQLLRHAISHNFTASALKLLKLPMVIRTAANQHNALLVNACSRGNVEVAKVLLAIPSVKERLMKTGATQLLHFFQVVPVARQLLLDNVTIFGLKLSTLFTVDNFLTNFIPFLENPLNTITSLHTITSLMVRVSVGVLYKYQQYAWYSEYQEEPGAELNPDNDKTVGRINQHYQQIIKPALADKWQTFEPEPIHKIEAMIRETLLKAIYSSALKENTKECQAIVKFLKPILENKEQLTLLCNADPGAMLLARIYFTSSEDSAQIAWRAYDKEAPIIQGPWLNLLTPSDSVANIHTLSVLHTGPVNGNQGAMQARELLAYTFLLVNDDSEGEEARLNRIQNYFIPQVADIRRAHNTQSDPYDKDDPSCLPGMYTRAGIIWSSHRLGILPTFEEVIPEILQSLVFPLFKKQLESYNDFSEREHFYNALTMLTRDNAEEVIAGKVEEFTETHAKTRTEFVNSVFFIPDLPRLIQEALIALQHPPMNHIQRTYTQALVNDIGGKWIIEKYTALYLPYHQAYEAEIAEKEKPLIFSEQGKKPEVVNEDYVKNYRKCKN